MNLNQNSNNAWDTLAVLGVLFQIQDTDNHNFDSIVQGKDYFTGVIICSISMNWGKPKAVMKNRPILQTIPMDLCRAVFLNRCAVSSFQVCREIFCPYFRYSFGDNKEILLAIWHFFWAFFKKLQVKVCRQIFPHV